ncbi:hypothetical protein OIV83_002761 [Microbotryomycetes sp. JL201]|nr:hypothetical protein OIV83_002761 [Microbotryomycetes sp. JL201]
MVILQLQPHRGNHQRFFPHAGFLGLSPVVIQGTVKTSFQEDQRPIKASALVVRVRCYEARVLPGGKTDKKSVTVLHEERQEVWSKQAGYDWSDLGELTKPFRVTIGVDAGGVSTCTFKNYRAWWSVEAIIYHKTSALHGSRQIVSHQIPLSRYSSPSTSSAFTPIAWEGSESSLSGLRYSITASNKHAIGPGEPLDLTCVFTKDDSSLSIRKVHIAIERRVSADSACPSPSSSDDEEVSPPPTGDDLTESWTPAGSDEETLAPRPGRSSSRGLSSVFKRGGSVSSAAGKSPLSSPVYVPTQDPGSYFGASPSPPVASTSALPKLSPPTQLAVAEADDLLFDVEHKLACVFPVPKSIFRYSVGETVKTKLVSVEFVLAIRIHVKGRHGSTTVIELQPRPITVVGKSAGERAQARAVSGRILALADAETRLFDPEYPFSLPESAPSPDAVTPNLLGARRSSGFNLKIEPPRSRSVEAQIPTPPRTSSPAEETAKALLKPKPSSIRRRSEQSDQPFGAPVRSRARFTPESSTSSLATPSTITRPRSQLEGFMPATPPSPDLLITPTNADFSDAVRGLPLPSKRFLVHADSPSQTFADHKPSRRSGRAPYSTLSRPRSAGQLSIASQKSTLSTQSQDSATSTISLHSYGTASSKSTQFASPPRFGYASASASTATLTLGLDMPQLSLNSEPASEGAPVRTTACALTANAVPPSPALSDTSMFSAGSAGNDERSSTAMTTEPDHEALSSCGGDLTEDDALDCDLPLTPPVSADEYPSSPAIDFQSFSLTAVAPHSATLTSSTRVDPLLRAQIAPWSVEDEYISPFDTRKSGDARQTRRHQHLNNTQQKSVVSNTGRSQSMSRANSLQSRARSSLSPLQTASSNTFRRKSAGGFALFSSSSSSSAFSSSSASHQSHSQHYPSSSFTQQPRFSPSQTLQQNHHSQATAAEDVPNRWNFLRRASRA